MHGLSKAESRSRSAELLELMDLTDDAEKLVLDYSQGMRKKTALAAALIHAPRVLFLDEPFEGVDAISKRAILDVLQKLRASGTTIFFSSHILEVAERLCTRIGVISGGSLVAEGTLAELRQRAQAGEAATLEDLFLRAVGASDNGERSNQLTWLDNL
jgi:ABC-2 type transport system ATP-binding protein